MPPLIAALAVLCMFTVIATPQLLFRRWLFWGWRLFRSPAEFGQAFARELGFEANVEQARWSDMSRAVRALERVRVHGVLESGRAADVRFAQQPGIRNQRPLDAVLTVRATDAPPIRITRELLRNKLAKLLGLQKDDVDTGDGAFDAKFVVKAADKQRARATLEREVRDLVIAAFDQHGVHELAFDGGGLHAYVQLSSGARPLARPTPKGGLATPTLALLELLDRLARTFERVPLDVHVLGGTRRALLGLEGKPRCAYCHEGVTGDEPDLVACDHCATICHEGCWTEHGSCPVLGCSGGHPERALPGAKPERTTGGA